MHDLQRLFDPQAEPSLRRRGLLWVWLGAGLFQALVAFTVWGLFGPTLGIPDWVGPGFGALWVVAGLLLEVAKARLSGRKPATLVQACLLDAALLGFALVLSGLGERMGLAPWPALLALLGLGHYGLGFVRLQARL